MKILIIGRNGILGKEVASLSQILYVHLKVEDGLYCFFKKKYKKRL
ncbi:hypothetical protein HMPREF1348_01365 [Enterococcus faecium 505]|uniref:Uncharacterized protein n=1 Tax=Enterococcus faecium 505 TaxID=1134806 RepID=J7CVL6_ENTFC|nr:hypothetical protein M395_02975 [Enterococcus faecium T110]EJY45542.1 hypothetical protein HMPREF1348_01365 [Enterococcus faecium 505]GEA73594.1 hypothetical protein ESP02_19640 [Enterococcus sp. NBRC 3427]